MRKIIIIVLTLIAAACSARTPSSGALNIEGNGHVWGVQTLSFEGPLLEESRAAFMDYALSVTFHNRAAGESLRVNGYFAADGNSAESGAASGNIWRAKFVPARAGDWHYEARLISAPNIALLAAGENGGDIAYEKSYAGKLTITQAAEGAPKDFFDTHGPAYDGKDRYLKLAGSGKAFLKTGAGSPENILAYADFDNTFDIGGTPFPALGEDQLHSFTPHMKDARPSDPTWRGGQGAAILGIANYYEAAGVNAQYIVTMNVEGDGQDVFPWTAPDAPYVFDVSKLAQWERVLSHFNARGVLIDMLLTETENESWFEAYDGAEVGVDFADSRKLYYREMAARFGHLRGLVWNLGEENGVIGSSGAAPFRLPTSAQQRLEFGRYLKNLDGHNHAILSHNWPDAEMETYGPKLGVGFWSGISLQAHYDYAARVIEWTQKSKAAGRPWMVTIDEPLGWEFGARPDASAGGMQDHKREIEGVLWPAFLSGAGGVDWYFGWQNNAPTSDLSNEDQRSRDDLWKTSRKVREFLSHNFDMTSLSAQMDPETGTLTAGLTDKMGREAVLTLTRRRPDIPKADGHVPWEYEVLSLVLSSGGESYDIDTMAPAFPAGLN